MTQYSTAWPLSFTKVFFSGKESFLVASQPVLKEDNRFSFFTVASEEYNSKGFATSVFTYTTLLFPIAKLPTPWSTLVNCSTFLDFISALHKGNPPLLEELKYIYFSSGLQVRDVLFLS